MQQQPVDDLERALLQVLVGTVDGIARLEPDHPVPPALDEGSSGLRGRQAELAEGGVLRHSDDPYRAGHQELTGVPEGPYAGMGGVGRPEHRLGLGFPVAPKDRVHVQDRDGVLTGGQGHP